MLFDYAATTHVGLKRTTNEDSYIALEDHKLFVVADGMGGHGHGDLASKIAVQAIEQSFATARPERGGGKDPTDDPFATRLTQSINRAHAALLRQIELKPQLAGMGTTIVCAQFANSRLYVAHVGDSRCYCLRDGELHQLTRDHSLVNELRDKYNVGPEQEEKLAGFGHVVSRALGVNAETNSEIELTVAAPRPGDTYLLCSDGLTDEATDAEITETLSLSDKPGVACKELLRLALAGGGKDNITTVVVRFIEGGMDSTFLVVGQKTLELTRELESD